MENHFKGSRHGCLFDDCNIGGGMAYLFCLKRSFFVTAVFLSLFIAEFAFASFPATYGVINYRNNYSNGSRVYPTLVAACQALGFPSVRSDGLCLKADGSSSGYWASPNQSGYSCPANAVLAGDVCNCDSSTIEHNGSCISAVEQCKNVAQAMGIVGSFTSSGGGLSLCYGGCSITASGSTTGGSSTEYHGPFTSDGTTCTTSPASQTQNPCPAGSTYGTVNGLSMCSPDPNTNVIESGPKTTASSPSGAASAPKPDSDAPSTATGSESSTSCTGGKCTTTKKYTDSSGAVVGTITKTGTQSEFCASNPGAAICQKAGTFSGTCGAPPVCTGDAVMCAVAKATFESNCALKMPETSDEKSAYEAGKAKAGDQTGDLPKSPSDIGIGPDKFSQDVLIGGGSGMTDLTFSVHGQTVTLPFSTINPWLSKLGVLLQAVTFLICAYIVTGNKQGGSA